MAENDATLIWRRRCGSSACVEIAADGGRVLMRDSQDPDGPWLSFVSADWRSFVDALRADRPAGPAPD